MTTRGTAALVGGIAMLVCGLVISRGAYSTPQNAHRRTPQKTPRADSQPMQEQFTEVWCSAPPAITPADEFQLTDFPAQFVSEPPKQITPQPLAESVEPEPRSEKLRAMIRKELPTATEQEISVWTRQLSSMRLSEARDLIRIRRQFRAQDATTNRPRLVPFDIGATVNQPQVMTLPKTSAPQQPLVSQRTKRPSDVRDRIAPSLKALRQARNIHLHNIANANTPGFKRSMVVLGESPGENADGFRIGGGVRIVAIQNESKKVDIQHELAALQKIAQQMQALNAAARMFEPEILDGYPQQPLPAFPQAERKHIQPTSGTNENSPDERWGKWLMSPKAREIERNFGIDD